MDDYIRRKSLLKALEEQRMHAPDQSFKIAMNMAEGIVEQHPAADVEKIRHAKWILVKDAGRVLTKEHEILEFACSKCKRTIEIVDAYQDYLSIMYPYCHCGARMDEEK